MANLNERIVDVLTNSLTESELVSVWNEYCDRNNYFDDRIEDMGFLDDECEGMSATDIIKFVSGEEFDIHDNWYKHTIYGLRSFDDPVDEIDIDDLANYIEAHDDDLGESELRDVLDETDDDDEE